jgi:hypothetical protein
VAIIISIFFIFLFNGKIKINLNNIFHPPQKISSIKIDYNKILTDINPDNSFLTSSMEFAPVPSTPTLPPPQQIPTVSTIIPTEYVLPTYIVPTKKHTSPTLKPTHIPPSPVPTIHRIGDLPLDEPLKQPYYGKSAAICYTPEYFIKYYGGNLTPNACYANIKANVEANLVKVNILGRSLQVNKDAAVYFQAVGDELAKYQINSTTFKFPSKTYEIKTIGTYVFRCNVNASTGDPYDTCQSGCVIGTHAFGIAIDINWDTNCNGCSNYDMPPEIINAFERWGFRW